MTCYRLKCTQIQAVHGVDKEIVYFLCLPHFLLASLFTPTAAVAPSSCRCGTVNKTPQLCSTSLASCPRLSSPSMWEACKHPQPFWGTPIPGSERDLTAWDNSQPTRGPAHGYSFFACTHSVHVPQGSSRSLVELSLLLWGNRPITHTWRAVLYPCFTLTSLLLVLSHHSLI